MAQIIATIFLGGLALYLLPGLIFSIGFVIRGVRVVDENSIGTKAGFRLIIIPGTILLWPLLLRKWIKKNKQK